MTKTPEQIDRKSRELKLEFGTLWRDKLQPITEELRRAGIAPSALAYEIAWKAFREGKQNKP